MHIVELKEECVKIEGEEEEELIVSIDCRNEIGFLNTKRALIGVAARVLFYPTLLYNVVRNKIQSEFHWWDAIDEFVLLGAVPFPADVPHLKQLGVCGVITLNEPYETLVPTSLYQSEGIDHLVIPTRDYLFAPSFGDICQAVDFIYRNACCGKRTYVHCKAGRGRSTTIVLCYLIQCKGMTAHGAYRYVKKIRPRVLLAPSQWQAVEDYYHFIAMKIGRFNFLGDLSMCLSASTSASTSIQNDTAFDENSIVVVTESDLDGYDGSHHSGIVGNDIWAELSMIYKIRVAGRASLARLSCLWIQCDTRKKLPAEKVASGGCSMEADQLESASTEIPVY